jgi:hypothetical protein
MDRSAPSLRAKRSNPFVGYSPTNGLLRRCAPRNDGEARARRRLDISGMAGARLAPAPSPRCHSRESGNSVRTLLRARRFLDSRLRGNDREAVGAVVLARGPGLANPRQARFASRGCGVLRASLDPGCARRVSGWAGARASPLARRRSSPCPRAVEQGAGWTAVRSGRAFLRPRAEGDRDFRS